MRWPEKSNNRTSHNHIDSLHKTTLVQDFNNLIVNNHKLEKQTEVQKYRIANLRTSASPQSA